MDPTIANFPVPLPAHDEAERLATLRRLGLLNAGTESAFNRVTRLASRFLGVPVTFVSFVEEDRIFLQSCQGLEGWTSSDRSALRSGTICSTVIDSPDPVVIGDARELPRFRDLSLVLELGVVAYLGIPLVTNDGHALGSFCAVDTQPRVWSPEEVETLRDLAASVMAEIHLRAEIAERIRAETAVQETNERFRVFLEGARDHVLILMDMDGVILDWQGGAERILGWTKEEAIGRHGSLIFTPEDRQNGIDAKEFARATDQGVAADIRWHVRKDGSRLFGDGVLTRLNDPDGRLRGFAKVFQDATARKVAEDTLAHQAEALKQADIRKNEFLAMLAHELRNPLAAIRNALGVAKSGGKADLEWGLKVIGRQMRGFTHLIDDLLDVSRITQGKIQLRKAFCDVGPIIRHAAEAVAPLIREKKHTLVLGLADGVLPLEADTIRLEQILVNVLTNAAKYTQPEGRIELTAAVVGSEVVIEVKDNGVGIAADQLPRMFELFAQADRSLARSEGGLGIGLTLVQSLTEMHGGTITATSAGKNLGSEFTIRLPAADPSKLACDDESTPDSSAADAPKLRVLVVDDNQDTARGMARLLKIAGHEVQVAHDGWAALEVARDFAPEAVLLDIGLPGLDGYEVATRLRHEANCHDTLLIAASGYGEDQARDRSRKAGFDHHLTKPIDFDTILGLLQPANR